MPPPGRLAWALRPPKRIKIATVRIGIKRSIGRFNLMICITFGTGVYLKPLLPRGKCASRRTPDPAGHITCCLLGKAEAVAAFHRKFREGTISQSDLRDLLEQFEMDSAEGGFHWLPLSAEVVDAVAKVYSVLPETVPLRSADAMHLACAARAGLKEIYSNDQRLLTAACHFGITGVNII